MFVWIFHRISGVVLIFLLAFQLFTGFYQASSSTHEAAKTLATLHQHAVLNCLMVLLFIFHALYGLRTILMDLGLGREKVLFWGSNVLGVILFAAFLVFYVTLVGS